MLDVYDTVDGSESRRSPVEVGKISHFFTRFDNHPSWLFGMFEPSKVFGYIWANYNDQPACWWPQMVAQ